MKRPNKITPANAGWCPQFRFRGPRHRPGVAEFWRWHNPGRIISAADFATCRSDGLSES
jgi:hypothetical protein